MTDLYMLTAIALFQVVWFVCVVIFLYSQKKWLQKRDDFYLKQFSTNTNKAVIEFINETKLILLELKEKI